MLIDYLGQHLGFTFLSLFVIATLVFFSVSSLKKKEQFTGLTLAALVVAVLSMITLSASHWFDRPFKTVVVMPNKKNLRLGEDGELSFCVNGYARTWEGTENGIVATSVRMKDGKPVKCLTVEEGIEFLRTAGASEEELEKMRKAYE